MSEKIKVLFVCMGNICRSPTAEGVFRDLVKHHHLQDRIHIDSAGTHAYHIGEAPDPRSQAAALKHGIDLSRQKARKVEVSDFAEFDYILAMDRNNYADLIAICPDEHKAKVHLFLHFAPALKSAHIEEVPDPYYGGNHGFETVLKLVDAASEGLLEEIRQTKNWHSG
jgi:protein-tyrosine phosphatase